jgi:hypothetical protein
MGKKLALVAQYAMDAYYQQYKSDNDFFDLEDFVFHTGAAVSSIYSTFYKNEHDVIAAEKRDDVPVFDVSWLEEAVLEVQDSGGEAYAKIDFGIMSFPYDTVTAGIQSLFIIEPVNRYETERIGISAVWQLKYLPVNNRIYFYGDKDRIVLYNKGNCVIKKIRLLYVPTVSEDMSIPDGIIDMVITKTVASMKGMAKDVVVKKDLDGNENKILQTEMDKSAIK